MTIDRDLTLGEAENLCCDMISGSWPDEQIASVLTQLRAKGETAVEVAGFSRAIVSRAPAIPFDSPTIDVCGTGGSTLDRFNVSTAAAFVLACFDLKVAKHGNKGSRRPNGSFDLLEILGFPLDLEGGALAECLHETNLAFLFARKAHPAMKSVAAARQKVTGRTIFNLAGPLSNPTQVAYQVVGTADRTHLPLLAEAAGMLGRQRLAVVYGEPGIDELSLSGPSFFLHVDKGAKTLSEFHPSELGLSLVNYDDLPTGLANHNAVVFLRLLDDEPLAGLRDMVCLNAALALHCAGTVSSLQEGFQQSRKAFQSGDVKRKFHHSLKHARSLSGASGATA